MGKILILVLLFILDLGSISGYVYLNKEIIAGEVRIAEGKVQLAQGEAMLAKGKARLSEGQRTLSHARKAYNTAHSIPFMKTVTQLPIVGAPSKIARKKIAQGDYLVAQGKSKISSGESQLNAGKLELQSGIERLNQAKILRTLCLVGGMCFTFLLMVLGVFWRRSLVKIFK